MKGHVQDLMDTVRQQTELLKLLLLTLTPQNATSSGILPRNDASVPTPPTLPVNLDLAAPTTKKKKQSPNNSYEFIDGDDKISNVRLAILVPAPAGVDPKFIEMAK
ncbi:conserved hypothetical protein [Ricinus communis]|uniref:Uncharacterized protein n=1 Tax=Ricinus communis TaxID=3988 RepID=B9SQF8_RICCO|nr:conserved hypothetical protein [Ricinus communis]